MGKDTPNLPRADGSSMADGLAWCVTQHGPMAYGPWFGVSGDRLRTIEHKIELGTRESAEQQQQAEKK